MLLNDAGKMIEKWYYELENKYPDKKLWQGNYWEDIIRHEQSYWNISQYIIGNPPNWEKDKLFNR